MSYESSLEWYKNYLTSRGIDVALAEKLGVKLLRGDAINDATGRKDGHRVEAGILLGDAVRCMRQPIWMTDSESFPDGVWKDPDNQPFGGEWKARAKSDLPMEVGTFEFQIGPVRGLVRRKEDDSVERVPYYPLKTPEGVETAKMVARAGMSRELYAPEEVKGKRPLLIVEGATRVLAVLSNLNGFEVDVVAVPSSRPSKDNLAELKELAANATDVIVVLDADVISNLEVGDGLNRICSTLFDEEDPAKVRVGIPDGDGKTGLDDWLAKYPQGLSWFVSDALPWHPDEAIRVFRRSEFDTTVIHSARGKRPEDAILLFARHFGLVKYANISNKLLEMGSLYVTAHPHPEGALFGKVTKEDVAAVFEDYVAPDLQWEVTVDRMGQKSIVRVEADSLCTPVSDEAVEGAVRNRLMKLLGKAPVSFLVDEGIEQFWFKEPETVIPVRRSWHPEHEMDRPLLAYAEIPVPKPGKTKPDGTPDPMDDWAGDAWEEFMSRMSSRDMFLTWVHTLTLPIEKIDGGDGKPFGGRQALYLKGGGQDGKSTFVELLMGVLRGKETGVAVLEQKVDNEHRFMWAKLKDRTRLFVMDDVQNPKLFYNAQVRNLISGGTANIEKKGKDGVNEYVHPRVLICSNFQLEYYDHPSRSRVIQIDLEPRAERFQDAAFKTRLLAELPRLLWVAMCRWNEGETLGIRKGDEIIPDEATKEVMAAGSANIEEELGAALADLEFVEYEWTSNQDLRQLLVNNGFEGEKYAFDNLTRLLVDKGCKPHGAKVDGKKVRGYLGVKRKVVVNALTTQPRRKSFGGR